MDMNDLRTNGSIAYRCWYHVVWCPRYRRRVLTSNDPAINNPPLAGDPGAVDVRLKEIIEHFAEETGSLVSEIEVMPDHVHMLVSVDPQYGVGKFIRLAKGRSSKLLREEFPSLRRRLPSLWTGSYFVATVGGAPLSVVKQYIENQRRS